MNSQHNQSSSSSDNGRINPEESKVSHMHDESSNSEFSHQIHRELREEAKSFHRFLVSFDQELKNEFNIYFYLLSTTWLNQWKSYVDYENIISGNPPDHLRFGQNKPGAINEGLFIKNARLFYNHNDPHPANIQLVENLVEGRDFIYISEAAWQWLIQNGYTGKAIVRPAYSNYDGTRKIELYLKKFNFIVVDNKYLRDIDEGKEHKFSPVTYFICSKWSVQDFIADVLSARQIRSRMPHGPEEAKLRFWKLDPMMKLTDCFERFKDTVGSSHSHDYKISFPGTQLKPELNIKIEDLEFNDTDYIFIEVKGDGDFNLVGNDIPVVHKCEFCSKYFENVIHCECNLAQYCTPECKERDRYFHERRCPFFKAVEEKKVVVMTRESNSKLGIVGLSNLGNTCFMNSGLQCMMNVPELSRYFLAGLHPGEINADNPLGSKGNLVAKYANLVKTVWFGQSSVQTPTGFKNALEDFASIFKGFQQHDSQEFLAYLIDGIHEDLNRVKKKEIVEAIDDDTKSDQELALMSWEKHLKRNQSIMVDLFQGQFKSTIKCPECDRVSITFDPFNTLSLPIPQTDEKCIEFYVLYANNRKKGVKLKFSYKKFAYKIGDLKKDVKRIMGEDFSDHMKFIKHFSYTSKDDIKLDDTDLVNDLRKKGKRNTLFCQEIAREDALIPERDSEEIALHFHLESLLASSSNSSYWARKVVTYHRSIIADKNWTYKDLYFRVFKFCRRLLADIIPEENRVAFNSKTDEEAYVEAFEKQVDKPYKVKMVSNARYYGTCIFCDKKDCKNCELEYTSDKKLEDVFISAKKERHDLEIELLLNDIVYPAYKPQSLNQYWDPETKQDVEKIEDRGFTSWSSSSKSKATRKIEECFQQFSVPEQLAEDNTWYCNKCKKHQQAYKKMEIYKAPPILIVHLKRFKNDGRAYSFISSRAKIQDLVQFPVEGTCALDLSPYVLTKGFPKDYPLTKLVPSYEAPYQDPLNLPKEDLKPLLDFAKSRDYGFTYHRQQSPIRIIKADDNNQEETKENDEANGVIKEERVEEPVENGDQIKEEAKVTSGNENEDMEYELIGVVNHFGSMGGGHYTAYAKNCLSGNWTEFDDSRTTPVKQDRVCTDAAYVLFYRKKNLNFKFD